MMYVHTSPEYKVATLLVNICKTIVFKEVWINTLAIGRCYTNYLYTLYKITFKAINRNFTTIIVIFSFHKVKKSVKPAKNYENNRKFKN